MSYVSRWVRVLDDLPGHRMVPLAMGGRSMATFEITFVDAGRDAEEVTSQFYDDHPPFVDFKTDTGTNEGFITVARYRAEDIQRIIRRS